jgi:hypothetical protein
VVHMISNLEFKYLGIVDCGQNMKFVYQVTGSARNGTYWVRITFYEPNDLKFGI